MLPEKDDTPIPLKQVPTQLLAGAVSPQTVLYWINHGIKNRKTGKRVKLRAVRPGGHVYVRPSAIEEFQEALEECKTREEAINA